MRMLRKNKQKMYYSLPTGEVTIYERDSEGNIIYESYTDSEGNVIYILDDNGNRIPKNTGSRKMVYSEPLELNANISEQGGSESQALPYGISTSEYEATIIYEKNTYPLVEGCLIWLKSKIEYENNEEETTVTFNDGTEITQKIIKETSADFRVAKLSESLNSTLAILTKMNK